MDKEIIIKGCENGYIERNDITHWMPLPEEGR